MEAFRLRLFLMLIMSNLVISEWEFVEILKSLGILNGTGTQIGTKSNNCMEYGTVVVGSSVCATLLF